ncbi:MAG: hypothetical protein JO159_20630 [Acidobacteria bacterium]|nr:hypothetical protein [Acidobacteriota bacterium]MBV9626214.1 hypothetical protein [Acidobacteriota bacterium]
MFLKLNRSIALLALLLASLQLAGQKQNPPDKTPAEKEIEKREQSQRMLGVVPQFGTTSRHNAPPLTPKEKFHLFTKSAFDPVELSVVGMQAAFSQAEDEFPEYGQGAAGYGKRYGATLADEVSSGFFSNFFYPVLLEEDPRYFRLGAGSVRHRIGYSLLQEVDCRRDRGGRGLCWENILGALTAGSVSNIYYPPAERGLGLTMSRSAIAIGYGSLGGLVDEFYPDISRWLFRGRHKRPSINP